LVLQFDLLREILLIFHSTNCWRCGKKESRSY